MVKRPGHIPVLYHGSAGRDCLPQAGSLCGAPVDRDEGTDDSANAAHRGRELRVPGSRS
jgi:hypothetical protein